MMLRTRWMVCAAAGLAAAAPVGAQQVDLGVLVGFDAADVKVVDQTGGAEDTEQRRTVGFGGVAEIHMGSTFSLLLEPFYSRGGATMLIADAEGYDLDIETSFLEVPLFAKVSAGGSVRPWMAAGPVLAYRMDSSYEVDLEGVHYAGDASDVMRNVNMGLAVAGGLASRVGRATFFVEARYSRGLSDLMRAGYVEFHGNGTTIPADYPDMGELTTRSLRLSVGATLPVAGGS